jgi:type VI secretion system FHA domain protein
VVLILEVSGPQAAQLGSANRKVFGVEGGLIGRDARSAWVLPHTKVSGRHARISHQNGVFYIEDTSTNGVFINSSKSRLAKGRPYALKSGDSIFIDPYTISVSINSSDYEEPRQRLSTPSSRRPLEAAYDPFNLDDPFGEQAVPFGEPIVPPSQEPHAEPLAGQEVDPLKLLGQEAPRRQVARQVPRAEDLEHGSPLRGHYKPPPVVTQTPPHGSTPEPTPPADPFAIPADYDPLAPDTSYRIVRQDMEPAPRTSKPTPPSPQPPPPPPPPTPRPRVETSPEPSYEDTGDAAIDESAPSPAVELDLSIFESPLAPEATATERRPAPSSSKLAPPPREPERAPEPIAARPPTPAPKTIPAPTPPPTPVARQAPPPAAAPPAEAPSSSKAVEPAGEGLTIDLRSVLEGAGLDPEDVTPDLARNFGEILRVVVAGVMEVLQARHNVKDEFRMRITQFRPADNNPLKFSANVDDALHNLLVKRNAAYLKPVEAFDDAFDDLRHHQLAMLAGMRMAFEAMLSEFAPERLQEQFDRQLKRGSLLNVAPKLRYWDFYRDLHEELLKDPEVTFRRLFGDAFAKAYEEQLKRLKAQQSPATPPKRPQEPD